MYMSKRRKKRKYTKRQPSVEQVQKLLDKEQDKIAEQINQAALVELRATENSFVFVNGCKTCIRNLPDQNLVDTNEQLNVEMYEVSSQLLKLENLSYNFNRELNFRGLK